jgi:hypothetical protein
MIDFMFRCMDQVSNQIEKTDTACALLCPLTTDEDGKIHVRVREGN